MNQSKKLTLMRLGSALIFTALTCLLSSPVCADLSFTKVPMTLGSLLVCLSGAVLGWHWGLLSVALYLLAGLCGLPVFAGGASGAAVFTGPTGGYLFGYLVCVLLSGLFIGRDRFKFYRYPIGLLLGLLGLYICGLWGLTRSLGIDLETAVLLGLEPFLLFELIKFAAATLVGYFISIRLRVFLRH